MRLLVRTPPPQSSQKIEKKEGGVDDDFGSIWFSGIARAKVHGFPNCEVEGHGGILPPGVYMPCGGRGEGGEGCYTQRGAEP